MDLAIVEYTQELETKIQHLQSEIADMQDKLDSLTQPSTSDLYLQDDIKHFLDNMTIIDPNSSIKAQDLYPLIDEHLIIFGIEPCRSKYRPILDMLGFPLIKSGPSLIYQGLKLVET